MLRIGISAVLLGLLLLVTWPMLRLPMAFIASVAFAGLLITVLGAHFCLRSRRSEGSGPVSVLTPKGKSL
jgi:hypothetical protein